ncbi:MAG: hypothetical protein CFH07_02155 [Alphaproteobacteria bacterium MarineAlpha3_Bin6]|nr:MAG: hypothetical protein CFH07_02155 [Alphaproteobacteria bacterium MarineAlpha3_Bin6]
MVPLGRIDGQVHSVFDKVCNLRLCDGSFLALGREDVFNGPGIIRCQTDRGFSFLDYIDTDEPCACRRGILRIGKHLQVDLRRSIPWQNCINRAKADYIPDLHNVYMKVFNSELSFSRVIETVANPERYLLRETNLPIALAPLVGKGPGLTPLGDDFIVGVAAGMEAHPNSRNLISFWLNSVVEKTTILSGRVLHYASYGWFIEPIVEFVNNLSDMSQMEKPIPLLTIGDTSGIAMAYGCLVGFQVGKNLDQKTGTDKSSCSIRRPIPNYSLDNQAA